jgi:hypothetical protein
VARALGFTAAALMALSGLIALAALAVPTADLHAHQTACETPGCAEAVTIEYDLAWSFVGQRYDADATGPAEDRAFERTWKHGNWGDTAARDRAILAQTLLVVGIVLAFIGAACAVAAAFTHPGLGIAGGALALVAALLVIAAVFMNWQSASDVGNEFVTDLEQDAKAANHSWEKDGVNWRVAGGLTIALVAALLALVGGAMGLAPSGYR